MKILIATGSTGGHVFPALALVESLELLLPGSRVLLVVPDRSLSELLTDGMTEVRYIPHCAAAQIRLLNPRCLLSLARVWLESARIVMHFRPDIAVGFGTLDCIPVMLLAWFVRSKTLIHEQNVVPGRANVLLSRFVDRVALSFAETQGYLAVSPKRVSLTGNPLRAHLRVVPRQEALRHFGLSESARTILVVGGSQGSVSLNGAFLRCITELDIRGLQVIHVTGAADHARVEELYRGCAVTARVFPFLRDMAQAYAASDFAVCRAGAMTVSELVRFALPAVLVPYPYALQHQLANAQFLEKNGCAVIIKEDMLAGTALRQTIADFLKDDAVLERMRAGYQHLWNPDGARQLAEAVVSLAQPRE